MEIHESAEIRGGRNMHTLHVYLNCSTHVYTSK